MMNDNLKSSGAWTAELSREQGAWRQARHERAEFRVRELQTEHAGQGIDEQRLLAAAQMVSLWAADAEVELTLDRLLELHRTLIDAAPEEDVLRKAEPLPINAMHDPAPALIVPRMLDNAFDWFGTDSFKELHPVERAAVVYLRLLDLYPFPAHNETTALLGASFYTERAGLPPLIIFSDEVTRARYQQALEAAFRMLTQPLVELFAEMLRRTMLLARGEAQ